MKTVDPNQDNITVFTECYFEISEFVETFNPFSVHTLSAPVVSALSAGCPYVRQ
ncbi:MAG: hypothetical protein R2941_10465 [Desulfobacterales bacterium]